jgi:uncharacterized membrane protein (GlpM family)
MIPLGDVSSPNAVSQEAVRVSSGHILEFRSASAGIQWPMMQLVIRFVIGGLAVCVFALLGEILRPKTFAGLFAAAPSVALATLTLTLLANGKRYAAIEARSMAVGALGFCCYALACEYLLGKKHLKAAPATTALLAVWALCSFGLWSLLLRAP